MTHGCLVRATVRRGPAGSGVTFHAGSGVGTVTRPGLQIPPGEAAINPVPRQMMREVVAEIAAATGEAADVAITIAIPGGEALAQKTLNPRLGIVGGLSILGTTGVVVPFSCAAWIHSIHRGIDVARAAGLDARRRGHRLDLRADGRRSSTRLPEMALLDMGDFAGGTLKYLRRHPVPRVTLAGGFAKLAKLAQGHLDLHSSRSVLDQESLARMAAEHGAPAPLADGMIGANTANQMLALAADAEFPLADLVAAGSRRVAARGGWAGHRARGAGGRPAGQGGRPGAGMVSRVLILGGTAEAGALARTLAAGGAATPILSLAGLTDAAPVEGVIMRSGGFGGPDGLAAYLRATGVAAVFDATHPFAARITEHAARACTAAGVPRFRLQRAEWQIQPGDRWHAVESLPAGLDWLLPRARRVFVTLGRKSLEELGRAEAFTFVMRGITRPPDLPANIVWVTGRPPFPVEAEVELLRRHEIRALFIQASGGELTYAKLAAARELGLPVVMLTRPQPPAGASGSVPEAMAWLAGVLGRRTCE